ncbi:MAG: hypothetical protein KIT34_07185 [Cyanobacteria bacterium TGS_CYA1]|nr:hypothetical protein [Cyanobacteria bacterium TGS_CYA1]
MTRKLRLQNPLVFEPFTPLILRRLLLLLMVAPAIYFGSLAMTVLSGVMQIVALILVVILDLLLLLLTIDGIEGKVIVDAEGLEWRSPLKKTRLLWNEGLRLEERLFYSKSGNTRVFDVISPNATITFGENLRNQVYLRSLINAGINGIADHNSEIALPPVPLDSEARTNNVNMMLLVAVMAFFGAILVGIANFDSARILYFVPTVQIKDVAKQADNYKEIRIKGKLHTEPPAVARDDKHVYGYQLVQLESPTMTGTSISTPGDITIVDGADKLTIRTPDLAPYDLGKPLKTPFKRDWQKSELGQLITPGVDEYLKDFDKFLANGDYELLVWNIEQDQPVEVLGHIKTENNSMYLQSTQDSMYWMSPSPNKKLEQDCLFAALWIGAGLLVAITFLIAAYRELKQT